MEKKMNLRKGIITALFIALCVVLPLAFHSIPNAGKVFGPMFIPILMCGILCGPVYGGFCGLVGPVLSSILTGMPVVAMLPQMMVEGVLYGAITGLMFKLIKINKTIVKIYVSLIIGLLVGKVVGGLASALIFSVGKYTFQTWATSYFVVGLPGIVVQLLFVPAVTLAVIKSKVLQPNEVKQGSVEAVKVNE